MKSRGEGGEGMISFILTSVNEDYEYIDGVFQDIHRVCDTPYEVVFTSEREYTNDWTGNVRYIHTTEDTSVKNYNVAAREARGNVIQVLADDHTITANPWNELIPQFNGRQPFLAGVKGYMQNTKKGIDWLDSFYPYQVYCFPFFTRNILDILGGVIFNESFHQGLVDHWLGFFASKRLPLVSRLDTGHFIRTRSVAQTNCEHAFHDNEIMKKMIKEFENNEGMEYNTLVEV